MTYRIKSVRAIILVAVIVIVAVLQISLLKLFFTVTVPEIIPLNVLGHSIIDTTRVLRNYKKYFESTNRTENDDKMKKILEGHLFPWLKRHSDIMTLYNETTKINRGIVLPTGDKYFALAVHNIRVIRMFNCTLPVEIYYMGEGDLSKDSIDFFNKMENVTTRDITDYFDNTLLQLKTYDLKPFAMLASDFQEPILLDADAVLLRSPEEMYNFEEYKRSGALFFIDREFRDRPHNYTKWFHDIFPTPLSQKLTNTKMYKNLSNYLQESGVVIIDKKRTFMGLLATCRLNNPVERKEIHSKTHGDKETFWLGYEMAQDPYEIYDKHAAIAASEINHKRSPQKRLCGHLSHVDHLNRLLWLNDGIQVNKNKRNSPPVRLNYVGNTGEWDGLCLKASNLREIHVEDKKILEKITKLWDADPKRVQK